MIQIHPHGNLKHIEQILYGTDIVVVPIVMYVLFLHSLSPQDKTLAMITRTPIGHLIEWQFRLLLVYEAWKSVYHHLA